LFEPLRTIGLDQAGIRRIFETKSRGLIKKWVSITDAAMHEKPEGFPGFKVSPAAFFMDAVQNDRMPPDWIYAHQKKLEQDQTERNKAAYAESEQECLRRYESARSASLRAYLDSDSGQKIYRQTFDVLLELTKRTEPERPEEAAHQAAIARIEKLDFQFPEYAVWILSQENVTEK